MLVELPDKYRVQGANQTQESFVFHSDYDDQKIRKE